MGVTLDFAPRLMRAAQAAHSLGISQSHLRTLAIPRKGEVGKPAHFYDRFDLDAYADSLETEGEAVQVANSCDEIWGMTA
jgi:hypothetical protein